MLSQFSAFLPKSASLHVSTQVIAKVTFAMVTYICIVAFCMDYMVSGITVF